jgi:DNA-binding NarL/FixJ family response regulator
LTNKGIAATLGISLGTVKDHVHRILVKSALGTRTAVAVRWQQR